MIPRYVNFWKKNTKNRILVTKSQYWGGGERLGTRGIFMGDPSGMTLSCGRKKFRIRVPHNRKLPITKNSQFGELFENSNFSP
jgi:hypothetical protein